MVFDKFLNHVLSGSGFAYLGILRAFLWLLIHGGIMFQKLKTCVGWWTNFCFYRHFFIHKDPSKPFWVKFILFL